MQNKQDKVALVGKMAQLALLRNIAVSNYIVLAYIIIKTLSLLLLSFSENNYAK